MITMGMYNNTMARISGPGGGWQRHGPHTEDFYVPFTHSLTPETAPAGYETPFTIDAGPDVSERTVLDHDGCVQKSKAGEILFHRARRVENLFKWASLLDPDATYGWIAPLSAVVWEETEVTGPNGEIAFRYTYTGGPEANALHLSLARPAAIKGDYGDQYAMSTYLRFSKDMGDVNFYQGYNINPQTVTGFSAGQWRRIGMFGTFGGTFAMGFAISLVSDYLVAGEWFEIVPYQLELVTGHSNMAPGEYVSNNVGTGPQLCPDFGVLVESEWDVTTYDLSDSFTWSSGAIVCNETISGSGSAATSNNIDVEKRGLYVLSYDIKNYVSGQVYPILRNVSSAGVTRSANGRYRETIRVADVADDLSAGKHLAFVLNSTTAQFDITNVSLRRVDHGTNADGVKCFDYAHNNSVDGNFDVIEARGNRFNEVSLKGISKHPVITNRLVQSEYLSDAAWGQSAISTILGNPSGLKSVAGLPGWPISGTAVDTLHYVHQTVTVTATGCWFTVFLAKGQQDWAWIEIVTDNNKGGIQWVDLVNGAYGTFTPNPTNGGARSAIYVTRVQGGWRVSCNVTSINSGTTITLRIGSAPSDAVQNHVGAADLNNPDIWLGAAFLSTDSSAQNTYVPTAATAVTAEEITIGFPEELIPAGDYTVAFESYPRGTLNEGTLYATGQNILQRINELCAWEHNTQNYPSLSYNPIVSNFKFAMRHTLGVGTQVSMEGGFPVNGSNTAVAAESRTSDWNIGGGGTQIQAAFKHLRVWNQPISDDELKEITR